MTHRKPQITYLDLMESIQQMEDSDLDRVVEDADLLELVRSLRTERCTNCNGKGQLRIPLDFRGPDTPAIADCAICRPKT